MLEQQEFAFAEKNVVVLSLWKIPTELNTCGLNQPLDFNRNCMVVMEFIGTNKTILEKKALLQQVPYFLADLHRIRFYFYRLEFLFTFVSYFVGGCLKCKGTNINFSNTFLQCSTSISTVFLQFSNFFLFFYLR